MEVNDDRRSLFWFFSFVTLHAICINMLQTGEIIGKVSSFDEAGTPFRQSTPSSSSRIAVGSTLSYNFKNDNYGRAHCLVISSKVWSVPLLHPLYMGLELLQSRVVSCPQHYWGVLCTTTSPTPLVLYLGAWTPRAFPGEYSCKSLDSVMLTVDRLLVGS